MYSSSDSGHGDPISDSPLRGRDRISDSISRSDAALVRKFPIMLRCMNPIPIRNSKKLGYLDALPFLFLDFASNKLQADADKNLAESTQSAKERGYCADCSCNRSGKSGNKAHYLT